MRIHLLSDLHNECSPFSPTVPDADVVILAGDIEVKTRGVEWVHGHSHTAADYDVAGTRVVCNPRGYSGEETGFYAGLVISL